MRVATLDTLKSGSMGEILAISDRCGRSASLRRVGLREGAIVEVLGHCDPAILRIDGSCLAVQRDMLCEVTVCRCGCEKEDPASQAAGRRTGRRQRGA